jgi:hypothetical protein
MAQQIVRETNMDWYGGLEPELDWSMIPQRPEDPEMRESASIWLFEENGEFAFPRIGIEGVGNAWENHRYDYNGAFKGGRILRQSTRGSTMPVASASGRNSVLGAGGLRFECVEPFRKWHVSLDDTPYDGRIEDQLRGNFRIFADADIDPSYVKTPVKLDVELTMAVPAWTQDYRVEKLAGMTEQQRTDAGLMGYGWRVEQLFRAEGSLTIDGQTRPFKGQGSRIHRQSVRPMGAFRGHCWQSAVFPDGRAFGYIAYPLRDGESEAERYNIGYYYQDGVMHPAKATKIPFLRKLMPEGDDVSLELECALGRVQLGGTTTLPTFHLGNAGVGGMNNNQGGVRYTLDGMTAYGMIERSSPADLCSLVE